MDYVPITIKRLEKISRKFVINPDTKCWTWVGAKDKDGYGMTSIGQGYYRVHRPAHRVLFEVFFGTIAKGLVIDHICYNRLCVNPLHLRAITIADNVKRRRSKYGCTQCGCKHN